MSTSTNSEDQSDQKHDLDDAEKFFKDACKIFQREAAKLRQERDAIDDMSKKLKHVHFSSTVKLNVGGHHFTTSLQTLAKDPNSMLAAMFSGKFDMEPAEDGANFIDRDGTHFRFILNYLRYGELILPDGATFLKELEAEAKFYQIQGILDELKPKAPKYFVESVIMTNEEHRRTLQSWLPQYDNWHLLFRASRDGFSAQAFHAKCDAKGPTVTILKSGKYIFGGFAENSWIQSSNGHHPCEEAFLFSMVNPQGLAPSKMLLNRVTQQCAIYCSSMAGPSFGGGCDMYISNNANEGLSCTSNLGHTYQLPDGCQKTFFTGAEKFNMTDYEVFGIHYS